MTGYNKTFRYVAVFLAVGLWTVLIAGTAAQANVEQMKLYKKAFPAAKIKCIACHVDKLPKKDEGAHGLSAYGLKVKETDEAPTEETYAAVGAVENFEAGMEGARE